MTEIILGSESTVIHVGDAGWDTIVIYAHDTPHKNRFFKQHPELKGIVPVCTGKDDQKTIQKAIDAIEIDKEYIELLGEKGKYKGK